MAYFQTEWQVIKMNGSRLDGPPRIEFWATFKEPGIDLQETWRPELASQRLLIGNPTNISVLDGVLLSRLKRCEI